MLGKIEGRRRRGHRLNGHEFEQTPGDTERQGGKSGVLQSMGSQSQTLMSNNKCIS